MTLKLYDTLTRQKREFTPIDQSNVRLYVCGPTVYDYAHIGNARPVIVFDVLFRLLRQIYGAEHVTYVRNITDVEDKINDRAARDFPDLPLNEAIARVTRETGEQFHRDIAALGVLAPTFEPRATEHIGEMRDLIERLVKGGFAYVAQNHVLFSPATMNEAHDRGLLPRYGALSNRSLDEMLAGARVDVAPYKRDPMDFVLWKPSKSGEPAWPSPAGIAIEGRPGWHIECSAMSWRHLGETFDIHGGGIDLVFPHHENEIAQTCSAFGHKLMANYWMHNGFLQVERQKMSKSLGNFVTIHELLHTDAFGGRSWPGEVLRLAMLKTHYRQPIDWTVSALEEAEKVLQNWVDILSERKTSFHDTGPPSDSVLAALLDDLNTPQVFAELHGLSSLARRNGFAPAQELHRTLEWLGLVSFGSFSRPELQDALKATMPKDAKGEIDRKVELRNTARAAKDWAKADRIRDELAALGIALKDNKDGTTSWGVKR